MTYIWLKNFNVNVGDAYPYFKVRLEILPPKSWNYPTPFYTFAVNLKIDGLSFGWYLYVGDLVNGVLEPGREFVVDANLKLLDIHALNNKSRWREKALRGRELKIESEALVYLLNYQSKVQISNTISASKVLEWINKDSILRNDFIPLPSPSAPQETANAVAIANVAMLYRSLSRLREEINSLISEKLKRMELLLIISEHGLKDYKRIIEKEVKQKYESLEPIANLMGKLKTVSNNVLDENWALSTLVLAALENIVNIKLRELGESTSGDFKARVSRLKEALVKKSSWDEREASDLARRLRGKYEERHIIIHGGYENPTTREAALEDLKFLSDVLEKLFKMG